MAVAILLAFATAMFEVYVTGVGPVPQQPPEGYTIERTQTTLQWNRGTRDAPIELQVAMDDPTFGTLFLKRDVKGKTHLIKNLENGHIYYWRLVQDEQSSPVATFKTSAYAVKF
ncbi:MAG: hypothetical protein QNJ97_21010 [Myxococcota bacterium]|nr:hypothetical protein [Myxococcota bacterium]